MGYRQNRTSRRVSQRAYSLIPVEILGSSSDYIILDTKNVRLKPGNEVRYSLDYGTIISVMTSP